MRRASGYLLQTIAGTDYLHPYGQRIADHRRGVAINETGRRIWELLECEPSRDELRREYLKDIQAQGVDAGELARDLDQFLDLLIAWNIIEDDAPASQRAEPCAHISIAGLTLAYDGPRELIDGSNLKAFCVAPRPNVDQHIRVLWGRPPLRENGKVLLRDSELVVCERESDYLLLFPTFGQISEIALSKGGGEVAVHCWPPMSEDLTYQFFHALRLAFLYLAQKRGMWAIHSASLLYRDKAWLFSAPAGTGKSTHVNLWKELYHVSAINGDLNLLALEDGLPVIHGIPWCGTSEIFDKRTLPLGGIVLLKRSDRDFVEELPLDRKALSIMQRFISPLWTAAQLEDSGVFAQELAGQIAVCRLHCTKAPSAAETMKNWIDKNAL